MAPKMKKIPSFVSATQGGRCSKLEILHNNFMQHAYENLRIKFLLNPKVRNKIIGVGALCFSQSREHDLTLRRN